MKNKLSWLDKLMIGVTYAEADMEKPDLQHLEVKNPETVSEVETKAKGYDPFDGETVPVR